MRTLLRMLLLATCGLARLATAAVEDSVSPRPQWNNLASGKAVASYALTPTAKFTEPIAVVPNPAPAYRGAPDREPAQPSFLKGTTGRGVVKGF